MEASLSAREFLKRFHLPQLVRLSSAGANQQQEQPAEAAPSSDGWPPEAVLTCAGESPSSRSSTSISSSFVALGHRDHVERSEWTYQAAARNRQAGDSDGSGETSGFRSLVGPTDERRAAESSSRFHSISSCPEGARRLPAEVALSGESIRLTPPSRQLNTSKLQLEQPFLLYKAFKKYDVCAYMIDLKNELTEKSGDPIYFPQNYPGWFSMAPNPQENSKPLGTIDEVCRSSAQVFLTRDELIGFQLPSKLSHLTKLKNNQLLALPLAINLDKINYEASTSSEGAGKGTSGDGEIKQVVIECGQTLKIRGVYEDVLPLFEGKKQQDLKEKQQQHSRSSSYQHSYEQSPHSIGAHQMEPRATAVHHHLSRNAAHLYHAHNGYGQIQAKSHLQPQRHSAKLSSPSSGPAYANQPSAFIYAPQGHLLQRPQLEARAGLKSSKLAKGRSKSVASFTGQRYARCVLLNRSSVDKLTSCGAVTREDVGSTEPEPEADVEEVEVLIPIEQRGRFYICATNQSIVNELYCYGCRLQQQQGAGSSPALVFRLSQIITLLNLSRRLSSANMGKLARQQHHHQHFHQQMPPGEPLPIRLPLSVQLVIGPRPANFSPSMFGSSSSLESYFRLESNVGGHSIACSFNRNFVYTASQEQGAWLSGRPAAESGPACGCAQRLGRARGDTGERYGTFSGLLRIEHVVKRDVLLACTIKQDPLVHLNLGSSSGRGESSIRKLDHLEGGLRDAKGLQQALDRRISMQSTRLLSLREDNSGLGDKQVAAKSSFSRLRVCRSLISLNGRRKRRPNIPNSMLGGAAGRKFSEAVPDGAGGDQGSSPLGGRRVGEGSGIAMVEFDCDSSELRFVRTFVESSIPTSSIPDLVLNRMEFCHRNSADWERQLKLSYGALSRDYDLCERQLVVAASHRRVPDLRPNPPALRAHQAAARLSAFPPSSAAAISTASSRSSSGVSSSGERRDAPGSLSSGYKPNSPTSSAGASPQQPANKLLRLVHRILPPFSAGRAPPRDQSSAKLAMRELGDHFRRELLLDCQQAQVSVGPAAVDQTTLMNAQKIHRKLLTGSVRHLAHQSDEEDEDGNSSTGNHLYESLERLNEGLRKSRQLVAAAGEAGGSPARCLPARRAGNLGKSMEFLVGGRRTALLKPQERGNTNNNSEGFGTADEEGYFNDEEEEEDEDEWWRSNTEESAVARSEIHEFRSRENGRREELRRSQVRQLQVSADRRRLNATGAYRGANRSRNSSNSLEPSGYLMEPVSIEACNEEFVNAGEEDLSYDSGDSDLESGRSERAVRSRSRHIEPSRADGSADSGSSAEEERIYVNLSYERERAPSRLVSRMERKLMRIRGKRVEPERRPTSLLLSASDAERRLASGQWSGSRNQEPSAKQQPQSGYGSHQANQQPKQQLSRRETQLKRLDSEKQVGERASRSSLADESVNSSASLCSLNEPGEPPGGVHVGCDGVVSGASVNSFQRFASALSTSDSGSNSNCSSAGRPQLWSLASSSSTSNVVAGARQVSLKPLVGQVTGARARRPLKANSLEAWPLATLDRPG